MHIDAQSLNHDSSILTWGALTIRHCLISLKLLQKKEVFSTSACAVNTRRSDNTLHFNIFTSQFELGTLKNGSAPGSQSSKQPFVSTDLCDQTTGSLIHNAPVLQMERTWISMTQPSRSQIDIFEWVNRFRILQLRCLQEAFFYSNQTSIQSIFVY